MSKKFLGNEFDIHGGGIDLIFPHHENEIAQSRCANDTKVFANYWVHNAFITISNEKRHIRDNAKVWKLISDTGS